ncbi:hypothetical protein ACU686_01850 [Yinghuangia aomiensis]
MRDSIHACYTFPRPAANRPRSPPSDRYARAVAARKAREDQARAADREAARARAAVQAAAYAARGEEGGFTPVLAPPDPDKPASRAMLAILGAMLVVFGIIAVVATVLS